MNCDDCTTVTAYVICMWTRDCDDMRVWQNYSAIGTESKERANCSWHGFAKRTQISACGTSRQKPKATKNLRLHASRRSLASRKWLRLARSLSIWHWAI